ncbi:DUF1272 domain-containing protein [Sulfitobacter sp. M57]|uniref:DUF1272 domain-containing protein n=1 Tax=unclassified Sulfitobacter TaxID=196795 RepID=UPI0023E20204|nr:MULTISPECIES: DUF1272 domain-containing protein [unclassified Sulfitobacter]MDF3414337.1 DUF1272 domain-containing protein [Sulfitobacter sp. KE5]MDF3420381.1 DUF1272 domain-containing protein [Sulfitobacter sp. KE43]MDF3432883.1 DUF1272 domain-containing protein [Sulfitobacter sp. KE42]MDF3458523.1 DUF1272 domain-containing protein [Sulfitobacter sp. S74]MDF3462423.1 DUF1272 domain-containing protein [Sulfitobacter sp. Ks18]
MLELRPNCEMCDCDLPPEATNARICSYECTFCATCVDTVLQNVCPNCAGGFVPRPIRPAMARRTSTSRLHHPPGDKRRSLKHDMDNIKALVAATKDLPPEQR